MIPLGLTAAASGKDTAIQKKIHASGTITIIISNEEMKYIMEIVRSFEHSGSLMKVLCKKSETKQENQRVDFLVCY